MGLVPDPCSARMSNKDSLSKSNITDREVSTDSDVVGASADASRAENGEAWVKDFRTEGETGWKLNHFHHKRACLLLDRIKREKGVWWMPWQQEAMKDVALCDKSGGGESTL